MLLAMLVDRKALKVDIPARTELRLNWAWDIDGRLHAQLFHAILHDAEFDGDDACHLDSATETDFTYRMTGLVNSLQARRLKVHETV
jgi:hypothetical protein